MDLIDSKLEAAASFGATHLLNSGRGDLTDAVGGITAGRMLDYVFVTVGIAAAVEQTFTLTGKRGTVVLVGIPDWNTKASIPVGLTVLGEKRIIGSLMGSSRLGADVRRLVALYQSHHIQLDELVSAQFPP